MGDSQGGREVGRKVGTISQDDESCDVCLCTLSKVVFYLLRRKL